MTKRNNRRQADDLGYDYANKTIWVREETRKIADIYVYEVIDDAESHLERIDYIRSAGEDDLIRIHINTPGGDVDVMQGYIDAIIESPAEITTRAAGTVSSAGCDLWLAGDKREIGPLCSFMFHNTQMYAGGDGYNVGTRVDFYNRLYRDQMTESYGEVLTPAELETIFSGGEVYIRGTDMQRRINSKEKSPAPAATPEVADRKPKEITIYTDDFKKDIVLETLSPDDFKEFSIGELKGVLESLEAPAESYLGHRNWESVAKNLVDFIKLQVSNGI